MNPDDSTTEVTDYGIDDKNSIPGKGRDFFLRSYVGVLLIRGGGSPVFIRISARRQAIRIYTFCGSQQILGYY
jgi:hypothetical protein